ncbi:HNH endonuclease [Leuconostoc mesenteroides]
MNKCILCKLDLNNQNKSVEHITLKSLGGKQKTENAFCKDCNNKLGQYLDGPFIKSWTNINNFFSNKESRVRLKESASGKYYNFTFDASQRMKDMKLADNPFLIKENGDVEGVFLSKSDAKSAYEKKIQTDPTRQWTIKETTSFNNKYQQDIEFDEYFYVELFKIQLGYILGKENYSWDNMNFAIILFSQLRIEVNDNDSSQISLLKKRIKQMSDSLIKLFGDTFKFNEGQFQFKDQPLSVVHKGQTEVVGIKKIDEYEFMQLNLFGCIPIIYPILSNNYVMQRLRELFVSDPDVYGIKNLSDLFKSLSA